MSLVQLCGGQQRPNPHPLNMAEPI
jgi:tRNA-splicing ligase RtcB